MKSPATARWKVKKVLGGLLLAQLLSLHSTIAGATAPSATAADAAFPSLESFLQASHARAIQNREAQAQVAVEEAAKDAAKSDLLPALSASAGYTRNQYEIAIQVPDGTGATRPIVTTAQNQLDATLRAQAPLVDIPSFVNVRTATRRVQALAEAGLARTLAERRLRTLTGLEARGEAQLPELDVTPPPPLSALTGTVDTLPGVRAATADEAASASKKSAAWLTLVPRLNAEATQRFTNVIGLARSPAWAAGVSAEWRLDPSSWGSARREQANVALASLSKQRAVEEAQAAIEDAHAEISARIARARAANAQINAARRAAETARARLTAGTATSLDVTVAERDVFDAEVAEAQARAELARSRAHLTLATRPGGEP
jgi:outer membrane protein TolC